MIFLRSGSLYAGGIVDLDDSCKKHTTHSVPNKMGFDCFMGYNCQRQAHTYYTVKKLPKSF